MKGNPRYMPKRSVMAVVVLTDGGTLQGRLFITDQVRISDLLNDERKFLPLQMADGSIVALSKSSIQQVTMAAAESAAYTGRDPWRILGLQEGASVEEVKRAYRDLCKINHPDVIKGFGLSPEYQELASRNTARINAAYRQILDTLRAMPEAAE